MNDFDRWRADARTHVHRGHRLAYWVGGDAGAPPLLAIHGFPSASWDWWPMWAGLTARFRVIAMDMIGFGWSAKPRPYDYRIIDQADAHEGLLAALGLGEVHVLAHDYGVSVAQELLARREERGRGMHSLVLLNGGLFPESHRPRRVQTLLAGPLGPLIGRLSTKRMFARGLRGVFGPDTPPSPQLIDELWTLLRHADGHRVLHQLMGYMADRRHHRTRWVTPLQQTRVPVRVINGSLDPVSGAHLVTRYRELVPRPDVVELGHIGHYPQVEDPAAVLAAFLGFHDRLASR